MSEPLVDGPMEQSLRLVPSQLGGLAMQPPEQFGGEPGYSEAVSNLEQYLQDQHLEPRPKQLTATNRAGYSTNVAGHIHDSMQQLNVALIQRGDKPHRLLPSSDVQFGIKRHIDAIVAAPGQYRFFVNRFVPIALRFCEHFPQVKAAFALNKELIAIDHPLAPCVTDTLVAYGRTIDAQVIRIQGRRTS